MLITLIFTTFLYLFYQYNYNALIINNILKTSKSIKNYAILTVHGVHGVHGVHASGTVDTVDTVDSAWTTFFRDKNPLVGRGCKQPRVRADADSPPQTNPAKSPAK